MNTEPGSMRRFPGSPAAAKYGVDRETKDALEARTRLSMMYTAREAVQKATNQGKSPQLVAAYDQSGKLLGFASRSDIKAVATSPEAVRKAGKTAAPVACFDQSGKLTGFVAAADLSKVAKTGDEAQFNQQGALIGYANPKKLTPVATSAQVKKAQFRTALRAAVADKKAEAAQPDAGRLLRALSLIQVRQAVRKSGETVATGNVAHLLNGALVRSRLSPQARKNFDALLAKTSLASRARLNAALKRARP